MTFKLSAPAYWTLGLIDGKLNIRPNWRKTELINLYFCFYTLLCASLLKVLGGPKRRIFL